METLHLEREIQMKNPFHSPVVSLVCLSSLLHFLSLLHRKKENTREESKVRMKDPKREILKVSMREFWMEIQKGVMKADLLEGKLEMGWKEESSGKGIHGTNDRW